MGRSCQGGARKNAGSFFDRQLFGRRLRAGMHRARRPHSPRRRGIHWEKKMKRTAQEIANSVGGELQGDGSLVLNSVASLKNAGPNDLTYAEDKFEAEVQNSRAGCVIVRSGQC